MQAIQEERVLGENEFIVGFCQGCGKGILSQEGETDEYVVTSRGIFCKGCCE
jgi:hypothetical protein